MTMDIVARFWIWCVLMLACAGLCAAAASISKARGAAAAFPLLGAGALAGLVAIAAIAW